MDFFSKLGDSIVSAIQEVKGHDGCCKVTV